MNVNNYQIGQHCTGKYCEAWYSCKNKSGSKYLPYH